MAVWKLAPALAAGNCVVLKPAEQTPVSILVLAELIGDLLPGGVLNIVNGFEHVEAGKPLASNKRIAKIAFTGETTTGRLIMQYASQNLIPVTLELGGKSRTCSSRTWRRRRTTTLDKALEGFAMFALNQGEVCTCPSRALVQDSIYDDFVANRVEARRGRSKQGDPLDTETDDRCPGQRTTSSRRSSPTSTSARRRARSCSPAASAPISGGELSGGYYVQSTVFEGTNSMRDLPGGRSSGQCSR